MYLPDIIREHIQNKGCIKDTVGMSAAGVYLFEDIVLKIRTADEEAMNEVQMLSWLNGKIPVPCIIEQISENECSYILMEKAEGRMACDPYYMNDPARLAELLADTLQMIWTVDITDCPCQWPLKRMLDVAEYRVAHNLVDVGDAQPDTFGANGFRDPEHLLCWLKGNQPEQCQVLSHGDFCLPNIFLSDSAATGLIDLGRAGVADPWRDIALCVRSLENNYSGAYGGYRYSGYHTQMLFDALGIQPDLERIRYYILLDELF